MIRCFFFVGMRDELHNNTAATDIYEPPGQSRRSQKRSGAQGPAGYRRLADRLVESERSPPVKMRSSPIKCTSVKGNRRV
ncbi:hypothetical protein F2P81_018237 [Scophthalmus maximus]|uniref:Uncharacterized protein n=1 Tax=Scophthalmus maximus TaxID=52904 RepID=A0A6A4SFC9_SCOMX|nr:hypothetical protein F2P81_018237 [Scophthalmus maximus]